MPYTQIIQLMVALILVVGAPSGPVPEWSLATFLSAWSLVAVAWFFFVTWTLKRAKGIWMVGALVERLQWAALVPLLVVLYFLDLKAYLWEMGPFFSTFPTLLELTTILIFVCYLLILWATAHGTLKKIGAEVLDLPSELSHRLRMLIPALVPYFVLAFSQDLLRLLPIPRLREIMDTPWFQAGFFGLFVMVMIFFIPPFIVRSWSCKPLPPGPLRYFIEEFLEKIRIRCAGIHLWPLKAGTVCTAAVLGIVPRWRYILLTPCLIEHLTPQEIEAVLAHEVTHIRRHHLLWYVFFIGAYSAILYRLFDPLWTWALSNPLMLDLLVRIQDSPPALHSLITVLPLGILVILYFRFLLGYFMRHFERQADLGVFEIQGHPWHLISALEKVGVLSGGIRNQPSWHHFSIAQRVEFLSRLSQDPVQITRYEKGLFLKKSIFVSVAAFLILLPQLLPVSSWKETAKSNVAKLYIEQLLSRGEQQPEVYLLLGNILSENKEYEKAQKIYEKGLELSPEDPELLNSLAWMYATAEDPKFTRPKEALLLATKAVSLKPAPHILDTLAESLFINGFVDQAIKTEEEALKKATKMRDYYLKQLRKFKSRKTKESSGPVGKEPPL